MRRTGWIAAAVALAIAAGGAGTWLIGGPTAPPRDLTDLTGDVNRGAYVARLAGCIPCHTDSEAGGAVLAGGGPLKTEFGIFYGPNITPHETDGVGAWTLEQFAAAVTEGRAPDGSHYYPSFPYAFYTRLSDQDIVDLWAAVRSVPAVEGRAPPHDLAFPYTVRAGLGAWKRLYLDPEPAPADWPRGRYLAEVAHCGACHTPRTALGGRDADRRFAGAPTPGGGTIPAITGAALTEAGWTVEDLAYSLVSGVKPDGDVYGGAMARVVQGGTQFWSATDRDALAVYLFEGALGAPITEGETQ
ncbi:MAG: cytochrome c [Alphaproteobacteria bacterium]|nr:cytochrome c [Alphaproteobacteria bacterium]